MTFATVRSIGRKIPGIEIGTAWGGPALVHRDKLVACMATNKQAEPQTLIVRIADADRDLLIEEQPDIYYLKKHYENYSCVLVRLSRVGPEALHDLLAGSARFVDSLLASERVRKGKASSRRRKG